MKNNGTAEVKTWGGIEFVRIPAGRFVMGSTDENELAFLDEIPQHVLEIPYDYWAGRFPVSNAQFGAFSHATSYPTRAEREGWAWVWDPSENQWGKGEGANWQQPLGVESTVSTLENHPVVSVCWHDALAFCAWLNQQHRNELQPGHIFCLPSEAEWEKAARGTQANEWAWGNDFDPARCNSRDGGEVRTTPVGAYSPDGDSIYGVADMAGNVWEWTVTLWGEDRNTPTFVYPYRREDGREDLAAGDSVYRIIRGGSFKDDKRGVRCACRDLDPPHYSLNNLGFRVFLAPILGR